MEAQILSVKTLLQASLLLEWIQSFICQPHSQLGRKGAICPFVQSAINSETLEMVFHEQVNGHSVEEIKNLMRGYLQKFNDVYPSNQPRAIFQSLLIVFPNIPSERSVVLDQAHQTLKDECVQLGLMIGQFHVNCTEPSVWNPMLPVMTSPVPFFALRHMSQHDILFLHQRSDWFHQYEMRMGEMYEQQKISNPVFVDLFYEAKQRFNDLTLPAINGRVGHSPLLYSHM